VPIEKLAQAPVYAGPPSWYYDPMNQTTQSMKIKKLRTKHAPKAPTKAKVAFVQGWSQHKPATGKQMVANLEGVVKNFATQAKDDRRQAALDRLAERNGETIWY
jgi:hypothetical protein